MAQMSCLEQGTRPYMSDLAEVARRWGHVPAPGSKAERVIRMGAPVARYDMYGRSLAVALFQHYI